MARRKLEVLAEEDCFALLGQGQLGRLVYQDDLGPVAVPVNYAMAEGDVILRVHGGAKRAAMERSHIAFEVDHVDEDEHSGWSVIVRGVGHEIPIEHVPELLHHMGGHFLDPWTTGVHNVWLQITSDTVTGRRFGGQESVPLA